MPNTNQNKAFSLIEISITILIIGILVAGISRGFDLYREFKLTTARSLTQNARVGRIDDLLLWLETTSEKSFEISSDDVNYQAIAQPSNQQQIAKWLDISPRITKQNKVDVKAGALKPNYVLSAINNLPALNFTNDNRFSFDARHLNDTEYTIFIVEEKLANVANNIVSCNSPNNDKCFHVGYRDNNTFFFDHYNRWLNTASNQLAGRRARIHTMMLDNIGKKYWLNGGANPLGQNTVPNKVIPESTLLFIQGNFLGGEFIIFKRALATKERNDVENYLGQKWGIKLNN